MFSFCCRIAVLRRLQRGRIGLLEEATQNTLCKCAEPELWFRLAKATLQRNGLDGAFQRAIYKALAEGRKKQTNVFLVGPTNAAKSFLVKPLKELYRVYEAPDSGSHQLETILRKEIISLNEFERKASWMDWPYFKRFLEGGSVSVARPKNRGGNVDFELDSPVIGTTGHPIQLWMTQGRQTILNVYETAQMDSRILYLQMPVGVRPEDVVECEACARCGAELYMEGRPALVPALVPAAVPVAEAAALAHAAPPLAALADPEAGERPRSRSPRRNPPL